MNSVRFPMVAGRPGLFAPVLVAALAVSSAGCGEEALDGHYWNITARGVEDGCTGGAADAVEKFEYRVIYDGTDIQVAIGPDVFASGTSNGCALAYESIVWTEERGEYEVSWRIIGQAVAQQGGNSCNIANGTDWEGTETFEIVTSTDPALSPGCAYEMSLEGKYTEEVK